MKAGREEKKGTLSMPEAAKEAKRTYMREYRVKNRDKIRAYMKEWRRANPDKIRGEQIRYWMKQAAMMELSAECGEGSL